MSFLNRLNDLKLSIASLVAMPFLFFSNTANAQKALFGLVFDDEQAAADVVDIKDFFWGDSLFPANTTNCLYWMALDKALDRAEKDIRAIDFLPPRPSMLDIYYSSKKNSREAYEVFIADLKARGSHSDDPLPVFKKPGLIVCLMEKDAILRIIMVDGCSGKAKQDKILAILKKDRAISSCTRVSCGGNIFPGDCW